MTPADLARAQTLGIRTQIDLRAPAEVSDQGRGPLENMGARYVHVPVIPEGGSLELARIVGDTGISGKRYLAYLELGTETWLRLFELFASAEADLALSEEVAEWASSLARCIEAAEGLGEEQDSIKRRAVTTSCAPYSSRASDGSPSRPARPVSW